MPAAADRRQMRYPATADRHAVANVMTFTEISCAARPKAPVTYRGKVMLQGLGRRRHCARLYRLFVPGGELWRPHAGWRAAPSSRLLIYPLSLAIYCTSWTFFGSVGLASRTGFDFLTIYIGPMLMVGPGLSADHPHRAARQGTKHHLDRRLHRGALRQEPGGGGDGGADRHCRHDPLYRAAAQSGVVLGLDHLGASRAGGAAQPLLGDSRAVCRAGDGDFRGAVRHAPHRRHRASGRLDAGDRDGIDRQAGGIPRRRHFRHLRHVPRTVRAVRARA